MNVTLENKVASDRVGSRYGQGRRALFRRGRCDRGRRRLREDAAQATVDEIAQAGGTAVAIPTDVTSEDSVNALVERTIERFGTVDVLWNCVGGIAWRPDRTRPTLDPTKGGYDILTVDLDYSNWQLQLNLRVCSSAAGPSCRT